MAARHFFLKQNYFAESIDFLSGFAYNNKAVPS
jgi:hypothetical protein